MTRSEPTLTVEELQLGISSGHIDTVALAIVDMQGRLQGKRLHASFFLEDVLRHGTEGCNYLLAVDVDMNTVGGYAMSSWERGYGDFAMMPDLATLRRVPWQPGTAMLLADLRLVGRLTGAGLAAADPAPPAGPARGARAGRVRRDGTRVLRLPRHLRGRLEAGLPGPQPGEPLQRRLLDAGYVQGGATVAPHPHRDGGRRTQPESAKGECNLGQHEIAFRYAEALTTSDNHSIYKLGAKEIAAQEGMSLTFMAKPNQREGNSCHIHFSLRDADGATVMDGDGPAGLSRTGERVLAGLLASMRELTLLYAPNINSYKRFQPGTFAPTAVRWGVDNRTCALRLVGHGSSLRVENRVPGGDVNPYLAIAGMVAAALHGIENDLELEPGVGGNAYDDAQAARVAPNLRDALRLWQDGGVAANAFGDEVVEHYANAATIELAAFDAAVTDWEMFRGFERL